MKPSRRNLANAAARSANRSSSTPLSRYARKHAGFERIQTIPPIPHGVVINTGYEPPSISTQIFLQYPAPEKEG